MWSQPGSFDWQRQMPEQSASHYWQPSSHPGSNYLFGQPPSHMVRPNVQTTIETQHDVDGIVDQNIPNRGKRQQLPSKYLVSPFKVQAPTTMVPKQRVSKTINEGKKANLSPLNLGGGFEGYNEEENNVTFLGSHFTGSILFYENVDPEKVRRGNYENPDMQRLSYGTSNGWLGGEHMNSWMELMIRRRPLNANWTVAYTGTISVHPDSNQFIIHNDPHIIGTLDGSTRPYPAWNAVDWPVVPGLSTPPSYSSGPSTPSSYSSGPSTPSNYSPGSSRNAECSNCKHLRGKISVLKATMEMHMHPEQHTVNSAALFHEVLNEMEKLDLE
ncbi:hypothetical protein Tco_0875552 [Tanacetum coccineum]|uniref:Uncharacterized protein n=1 Tax=Tanacetum coccineum TaxID=301880 RepID=A0ABQ5BSM0_9ASTR